MKFSKKSLEKLSTCEVELQELAIEAIKDSPYDFKITHGRRTVNEQLSLYAQGRTIPGKKVTNCDGINKKSEHNFSPSRAFDFAVLIDGKVNWREKYYIIVGNHIKEKADHLNIKIKWPIKIGNWYDYAHIQILS